MDGSTPDSPAVGNRFEKGHSLFHSVDRLVFIQPLVVCASDSKSASTQQDSHSLMAIKNTSAVTESKMLSHFRRSERWPPTSNNLYVSSPILKCVSLRVSNESFESHHNTRDTSRLDSCSQDVLIRGHVIRGCEPLNGVEEAVFSPSQDSKA